MTRSHHENGSLLVTREIQCDIGHRIPSHKGACRNVHGHRYRIIATARGPIRQQAGNSDDGMVADFGDLKELMMREVHAVLDHAFMVWVQDQPLRSFLESQGYAVLVMDGPPTAENLAIWVYNRLTLAGRAILDNQIVIDSITVWETPNCSAHYAPAAQGEAHR